MNWLKFNSFPPPQEQRYTNEFIEIHNNFARSYIDMLDVLSCFVMHFSKWMVYIDKPIAEIRVDISLPNVEMIMDSFIFPFMDVYHQSLVLMDFRKELYFSISTTLYVLEALSFHRDDEKGYSIIDLIVEII